MVLRSWGSWILDDKWFLFSQNTFNAKLWLDKFDQYIYCIYIYVFNTENIQSYHPSWTSAKAPQTSVATNCPPTTSVLYETTKGPRSSIGAAFEVFEIQKHFVKLGDAIFFWHWKSLCHHHQWHHDGERWWTLPSKCKQMMNFNTSEM